MAAERNTSSLTLPDGADKALLRALNRKGTATLGVQAASEHRTFVRDLRVQERGLAPVIRSLGVERATIEKAAASIRASNKRGLQSVRAPRFEPLQGHNPTRYAPFDFTWSWVSGGGLSGIRPYGPTARTGEAGYSIGIWNGGSLSTQSAVGFWLFAGADGTLHVTLNASIWGRAYIFSGLFGYASAYAGLRLYIQPYSPFRTYQATAPIYNNNGVLELDIRSWDWVSRSVSLSVPARRNTWYAIWGASVQSAGAGGVADAVSNFDMYMGPVTYWID